MTTRQESKLKMYLAVKDFLVQNEPLTKELPEFPPSFTEFQKLIGQIQLLDEQLNGVRTGIAKDKKGLRDRLISLAAENSRKVFAYAKIADNKALIDEVNFSLSDLTRMTDVALKSFAESLHKKTEANISALPKYGITAETQKLFSDALSAFSNAMPKPRIGIAEKRKATLEMEVFFNSANNVVLKIDAIIGIIRNDQVNFYNGYKTVRKLVDTNNGVVALKATAFDLATGEPIKGAIFTFNTDGGIMPEAGTEISKKTAEKGSFLLKNMQPGTYKVVVKKPGYKEKVVTVSVSGGERSDLSVQLEKV
jgi:hypothetical protein